MAGRYDSNPFDAGDVNPFAELKRREEAAANAGILIEDKNWPPFIPIKILHHNIANDIPARTQQLQTYAYYRIYSWLEITRLGTATKKVEREFKRANGTGSNEHTKLKEQRKENLKKSRARSLNLVKSGLDILVAAWLLQLAPRTITPRVTGGLGFITSVISCYQEDPAVMTK